MPADSLHFCKESSKFREIQEYKGAMTGLVSDFTESVEQVADRFGLMQGEMAPLKRFAVGSAIGYAIAYGLKPGVAFEEGKQRPFGYGKPGASGIPPTLMPAWLITVLPGAMFALFI